MDKKGRLNKVLEYMALIWSGVLLGIFLLSLVLYFTENFLVFEPLYNLVILIFLLVSLGFYLLCKVRDISLWKQNIVICMTVLCFVEIIFMFAVLLGLAGD